MELQTRQGTIIHLNMKRRYGFLLTEDGRQVFSILRALCPPISMSYGRGSRWFILKSKEKIRDPLQLVWRSTVKAKTETEKEEGKLWKI